jgi:zinc transporter ZupT
MLVLVYYLFLLFSCLFSFLFSQRYGQLSGMVEPIAGIIGAYAVNIAQSILSYALSFAAGAMIYVVCDNLIPEAASSGNGKFSSCCVIIGFCVMMCLDVGFG